MSVQQAGVARRIGSAMLASAAGLIVGATAASVISAIVLLLGNTFEYRSLQASVHLAIGFIAEGMFWGLLGGAMFVVPPAIVAIVVFRLRNTAATAVVLSVALLVALLIGYYPRTVSVLFLGVPIWLGVRLALFLNSKMVPNDSVRLAADDQLTIRP